MSVEGIFLIVHPIVVGSGKGVEAILDLFLEKTPSEFEVEEIKKSLMNIRGVRDAHHIHIWSMDGINNYATLHIVSKPEDAMFIKKCVKDKLRELGISHVTVEIEDDNEAAMKESGDLLIPIAEGELSESAISGSLSELVSGKRLLKDQQETITIFDAVGLAIEDLCCAEYIYQKVKESE